LKPKTGTLAIGQSIGSSDTAIEENLTGLGISVV